GDRDSVGRLPAPRIVSIIRREDLSPRVQSGDDALSQFRCPWDAVRSMTVAIWFGATFALVAHATDRPNVIIIYTDDQGSLDARCYGADDLTTPAIDRLARDGVRFTQMYAPSAICSASRAGLMTGRFPARAGVPGNVSSAHGHAGMPTTEITIAEVLRDAGYATGHVGKWHLGYTPETMPNGQGFDSSFGHMGGCIDNYSHFFYWNGPNRHDLWRDGVEIWRDGEFFPELMVDECVRFIDGVGEKPFFLYWAINVPHYPMQGTARWRKHYRDLPAPRRMYAEFVSTMDECVGQVLEELDERGSERSEAAETRDRTGEPRGACLRGGLRVPSIVSWPGTVPAGEVRDQMAVGCDWYPTILDLIGLSAVTHHLDGKSLKKVILDDAPSPHERFYWRLGAGKRAQQAIREGEWKLLVNPRDTSGRGKLRPDDSVFLTNLVDDLEESRNVADEHPDVVSRLKGRIDEYEQSLAETDAQ
ncbi:Arylsulfatase J (ASJ), partial [Durusdinium trenchii]